MYLTRWKTKKGNLWIGTDLGLSYFDRTKNKFTNYTVENGLPNNMVFGILDDDRGNLWPSTNKGLSKFNLSSKTFKNFSSIDGLQGDEFKEEARWKAKSGALYFGGNNNFNEFYADSVMGAYFDPPIVFNDFQIFNKKVLIALSDDDPSPLKKTH